ncbi:MAG: hypothetical protein GY716_13190 [bacterium]|nr:hypothetical protein [bacterium]
MKRDHRSDGRVHPRVLFVLLVLLAVPLTAPAQWVEFADETGSRMTSDPNLGVDDDEEKDFAWGDIDNDGDIDLIVVRKQPFTSPGKRANVLFLNENGVLVDRTADYAITSDVPGDQGFFTPTNDRDVALVDLDGDTWLDIVTAVTISDGDPKHIGHPRIYMNLGEIAGDWQGFRHEDSRVPTMLSSTGNSGFNPRFCSVAFGDVTGNGRPDLWFGDYDSSGAGGFNQPAGADFNDRLLINQGNGFFVDATTARFSGVVDIPSAADAAFYVSAFGAAAAIRDMNGDNLMDVIKQTSLNNPLYVGVAYNNADDEGFFDTYDVVNNQAPYFISISDLNNDSKLDIVITDDGADRFLINTGNDADGKAQFTSRNFSYDVASDDGFGGNSFIADLNNDTWQDVLVTDVDVDISGCSRRMHIYRNLAGVPGQVVTLQEQTTGTGCNTSAGNPASCIVASIPSNKLEGVHDVAVFDIDDDGWQDMVVGRCDSTEIYMNQPPLGLLFSYPQGLPFFLEPGQPATFQMQVDPNGAAIPAPGTGRMFVSVNGGPFSEIFLADLGNELYEASLPAAANCSDEYRYYFVHKSSNAGTFTDPPNAPAQTYEAVAAVGTAVTFQDNVEGDVAAWSVSNDPSLASGGWEQAVPVGTVSGAGLAAAPDEDADAANDTIRAWVTGNGVFGGDAGDDDVDGGPTDLLSPVLDLSGTDATISYSRWFFSDGDDEMVVSVSGDGSSWVEVETIDGTHNSWEVGSFRVGDYIAPTSTVRVRFRVEDTPNDSVSEAAIDSFRVEEFICSPCANAGDCDDGSFCNGVESCDGDGFCLEGDYPCGGLACDAVANSCVECVNDFDCDDGDFCNGIETCSGNTCVGGSMPCAGVCDEVADACVDCVVDADCDDGLFCNGAELCHAGTCQPAVEACPGKLCNEGTDECLGEVELQPRMGQPLSRLTVSELERFELGRAAFDTVFAEPDGLGPIFNQNACGACHSIPLGGSGSITVFRFGHAEDKGVGFDPLAGLGGSLRQSQALSPECAEDIPPEANVVAERVTPSTLGFGLVEALADSDIESLALAPPAGVSGRVHMVTAAEDDTPVPRVGRFGWKSQVATVLTFSGDAALNEMGITNRLFSEENAPNGDVALLALCDTQADPEDGPDGEGFHFIDRVTDFQRFLAAPPKTPRSGMAGEGIFAAVGCASCHVGTYTTPDDPQLETALRKQVLHPYSDFLLHDMGENADFIVQGDAHGRELRTPPLWGMRVRDPMWHDGRVAGGTLEDRVLAAVALHDGVGSEGSASARAFQALSGEDKDAVIRFLDSLGRAEFDADGDNDVDDDDLTAFQACFTGPGSFYTPEDPCAVSDVDQDGDVDDDDFQLFALAADDVPAGTVLDGGTQLRVEKGAGGDLDLTWGQSCLTGDDDYEVYEGTFGDWTGHAPLSCSTAGATSTSITPAGGSTYYLVVPRNSVREGSYGPALGGERPASLSACLPQSVGSCF